MLIRVFLYKLNDVSEVLTSTTIRKTEDTKHLWSAGQLLQDYTEQYPRILLHTRRSENLKPHHGNEHSGSANSKKFLEYPK
jgi:hypothetical protein